MNPSPAVQILEVRKRFGDVAAVDGVSLDIPAGEFFALLGPSGCGKTTLLRMIAGLETPSAGRVFVGGVDVTTTAPHRRPVHMVFQHYALFPHLSVEKNVAFGLRYQGVRGAAASQRVAEALEMVRLPGYGSRKPGELSGGQRQRVALARALVLKPAVLLLDEPLGALDRKLRREMQLELKRLQRSLGITFVFVTHDQEEALTMSDRIAVMNQGRVEQLDAAERVFEAPRTRFVAEFMGAGNVLEAKVVEAREGTLVVASEGAGFRAALTLRSTHSVAATAGDTIRFVVRPEKLSLRRSPADGSADAVGRDCMAVTVEDRTYQGVSTVWTVMNDAGERISVYEQNDRIAGAVGADHVVGGGPVGGDPVGGGRAVAVGERAFACWHPRHAVLLDEPGGTR